MGFYSVVMGFYNVVMEFCNAKWKNTENGNGIHKENKTSQYRMYSVDW